MSKKNTRKRAKLVFILFAFIFAAATTEQTASQPQDEQIKEYVEVINAEVIVRAQKKGQLVSGLKQPNFTLYENGKKQTVTSFMEVTRKIGQQDIIGEIATPAPTVVQPPRNGRLFFLYFRVSEPESLGTFRDALDHFFKHIYRQGDYTLVMIKDQVFKITRQAQVSEVLPLIVEKLDETAKRTKTEKDLLLKDLDELFRQFDEKFKVNEKRGIPQKGLVDGVIARYRAAWQEYKYKYIAMNIDKLKAIADSLKTVALEKWGVVFYQPDTFPRFSTESIYAEKESSFKYIMDLQRAFDSFSMEMRRPGQSLTFIKDVQQSFAGANVTFHLLLSGAKNMGKIESGYLQNTLVLSDWQEAFTRISQSTGGGVIDNDKLKESLVEAAEKEDIYYRLTYAPKVNDNNEVRNIKVTSGDKRLKLQYTPRVTVRKTNEITIDNFSFSHPTLEFILGSYQQLFDGSRLYGDIQVILSAVDERGERFSVSKNFEPDAEEIIVSMKLNFPGGGAYNLSIEAFDKQTGKSAVYSEEIKLPRTGLVGPVLITPVFEKAPGIGKYGKKTLTAILRKAARYCEKLKKATFYFTCKEEVAERFFIKTQEVKNDAYLYDYQIILEEDGQMKENRKLIGNTGYKTGTLKGRGRKKREKEARELVITKFVSRYPFLMPVSLLSNENQQNYRFQLLARERVGNRQAFKIAVDPAKKGTGRLNHGAVWVDVVDGAVLKIELNPRALKGIERLQKAARRKGARLKVTDTHWYDLKKNGIRFPSRTEIAEVYLSAVGAAGSGGDGSEEPVALEECKTIFSYKRYNFFKVNVSVLDAGH
ncbi:MAG: hypothetical protein GY950_16080 [bacterium]|nr:hypothetical protein [bacterium]